MPGARPEGGGEPDMSRPFARLCWLRALIAVAVLSMACAGPGIAQQSAEPPRLESAKLDATRLDTAKLALDWIDAAFRREGLSVQALFDLGRSIDPVREELRAGIDDLEPRRVQLEAQLKQLGSAPA